ncbi:MAG: DUF4407 domain-containing protein [Acidobacteriota bacterium]|nr:DUF4407 domain-containing protein [Acidobacteriota bacterium]MDQ5837969.1 DUF4407 domain-containing protein [Acidobacteriota bacterium]
MVAASATFPARRSRALRAIFWGGLIAGALDITYAFVFYGLRNRLSPARILQSVASGLLGADAFKGGLGVAALGAALHFFIAFTAAAVYYAASRRLNLLLRRAVVCGVIYGVLIYALMNYVVVPLSAAPPRGTPPPVVLVTGLLVHMFFIGLPIALFARRYSR